MNKFFKSLALSGIFALSACGEHKQGAEMYSNISFSLDEVTSMDTTVSINDAMNDAALAACRAAYVNRGTTDTRSCYVNITDYRIFKTMKGIVEVECATSPWYFQQKYCLIAKPYRLL